MKKGWKIALAAGGVIGLGLYIWSRIGQTKQMVTNLVVSPMWYGGINDMKIDITKGIKLPLAVDFMNRSDVSCTIRLNSLNVVNSSGSVIAYSNAGNYVVQLAPYATTRMKDVDVWIGASTVYQLLGTSIISLINGDSTAIKNKAKQIIDGCTIELSLTVNETVQVSLSMAIGDSAVVDEEATEGIKGLGLVSTQDRQIKPLSEYHHLIPEKDNLEYKDTIIIKDVTPEQTAKFIRKVAQTYKRDTAVLAKALKGQSVRHTVENIWDFVAEHIQYVQDASDKEQVRRPLRTLYDQKGDCDCYATLIASICENLGYNYTIRIAEYDNKGYFQHVYVIVEGFVCDPVVDRCFYEKKPTRVKDF